MVCFSKVDLHMVLASGILAKPIVNVWLHGFIVFVQEQLGEVLYGDPDICYESTKIIFKVISTKCWYERSTFQT